MRRNTEDKAESKHFEEPLAEQESGRSVAVIAVLAILTIAGLVIWLLANQDQAS